MPSVEYSTDLTGFANDDRLSKESWRELLGNENPRRRIEEWLRLMDAIRSRRKGHANAN